MLKRYVVNGKEWQFEEGKQPEGAAEVKEAVEPPTKAVKPMNKARRAAKK